MNGYLDRITYGHRGSTDFGPVASSPGTNPQRIRSLQFHSRLLFAPNRPESTFYWNDGTDAAVMRRLPGSDGDGRDDRAHVLLGRSDVLHLEQALALAADCRIWHDPGWDNGTETIEPVGTEMLPPRRVMWEHTDQQTNLVEEIWPLLYASEHWPGRPIWVVDDLSEHTMVNLVRALAGAVEVLRPKGRPLWNFSTREDVLPTGELRPDIQFVPRGSGEVASNDLRAVVRYPYRDATEQDEELYRLIAGTYVERGPHAVAKMLRTLTTVTRPQSDAVLVGANEPRRPPENTSLATHDPNWSPQRQQQQQFVAPPAGVLPADPIPPPVPVSELLARIGTAPASELAGLVDEIARAANNQSDRAEVRRQLLDPRGKINVRFTRLHPGDRNRLTVRLLNTVTLGNEGWDHPSATRLVDDLVKVATSTAPAAEDRRSRRRRDRDATPGDDHGQKLLTQIVFVLSSAIFVLVFIMIYK